MYGWQRRQQRYPCFCVSHVGTHRSSYLNSLSASAPLRLRDGHTCPPLLYSPNTPFTDRSLHFASFSLFWKYNIPLISTHLIQEGGEAVLRMLIGVYLLRPSSTINLNWDTFRGIKITKQGALSMTVYLKSRISRVGVRGGAL